MKYIAIILCLVALAAAVEYNDWQQGAADGLRYGFKMGQAYQNALNGVNITGLMPRLTDTTPGSRPTLETTPIC